MNLPFLCGLSHGGNMNLWIHVMSASGVEVYGDHHGRGDLPPGVLARPSFEMGVEK
jgi:hypothetical protein